ncbi:MAG: hypothetical protein FJ150_01265 [Euryarchaeota archaeon]|nr:hypothetical protein [Euryarchaeota archaeon]
MKSSIIKLKEDDILVYIPIMSSPDDYLIVFPHSEFNRWYDNVRGHFETSYGILNRSFRGNWRWVHPQHMDQIKERLKVIKLIMDILYKFEVQTSLDAFKYMEIQAIKPEIVNIEKKLKIPYWTIPVGKAFVLQDERIKI